MRTRSIRRRWLYFIALVLGVIMMGAWFQSSPQSPPELPPPTIRVTTHLVLVDAVVTDKQGHAVTGLRAEDFALEENGKAQKIATFLGPAQNTGAPASLPPGIYSNRAQYRSPGGPIIVMVLDALNTAFKDQAYARLQMLRFVQEQFKPGQRMAVFTLTNSLGTLQDFTSDPQVLYAALQQYKPQQQEFASAAGPQTSAAQGTPNTGTTVAALDASTAPASGAASTGAGIRSSAASATALEAIRSFEGAQVAFAEDRRVEVTLNAMNSLGRILGGIPGRKSVIWVTGAFPFTLIPGDRSMTQAELEEDLPSLNTRRVSEHASGNYASTFRQSHTDEIRDTSARLSSAQVALYPIDARGLSISTDQDSQETMREMARETGGRAYVNQNEVRVGVERAFEDQAATYTLGYYPENKKWDGKYRSIKLKLKRDGVEVQNRRGYFAVDETQIKGYHPEQEVASALNDVVPATLVAFSARVRPPAPNSGKLGVDFLVDASTLSAEDASGGKKLNVAFYATMFSPQGKMLANRSQKVDQDFNTENYQQIIQHGMMLHMDLDSQPGNNQLRLAVQDNRTGAVGTILAPVNP